jgi:hypothetical protein
MENEMIGSCLKTGSTTRTQSTASAGCAAPSKGELPQGVKSVKVSVKVKGGAVKATVDAKVNGKSIIDITGARVDHKTQQVYIGLTSRKNFKAQNNDVVDAQRTTYLAIDPYKAAGKTYTVNITDGSQKRGPVLQSTTITFDKRCG